MLTSSMHRLILPTIFVTILGLFTACGGNSTPPAASNAPQTTSEPQSTSAPAQSSNDAQVPQACALLTVADVAKITGYVGGTATPTDLGEGTTSCNLITGKGEVTVVVTTGKGVMPVQPTQKVVDLENGAKGIASNQSPFSQDWILLVNFSNSTANMLLGGSAAVLDPDKKIAQLTKADGSTMTFAQAYEAFARALAHNVANGGQAPAGVFTSGDACAALTLDDVKQVVQGFDITGPDYQDSSFGGKQCIYRFRSDALQAVGFATLLFVTRPKFDADMKNFSPVSGIGDAAAMLSDGTLLDFRKGDTYVYMTFMVTSTDAASSEKIAPLTTGGLKQLAQKAAARIK